MAKPLRHGDRVTVRLDTGMRDALAAALKSGETEQSAIREAVAVRVSPVWKELRELWLKGKVAVTNEWLPIDANTPRGDDNYIFAVKAGSKIPFVTSWDDEEGWVSFNRCIEDVNKRTGQKWVPTHWMKIPEIPA